MPADLSRLIGLCKRLCSSDASLARYRLVCYCTVLCIAKVHVHAFAGSMRRVCIPCKLICLPSQR